MKTWWVIIGICLCTIPLTAFSYEKLTMRIEDAAGKVLTTKSVDRSGTTITVPGSSWVCEGSKYDGYLKETKQDFIGIYTKCRIGKAFTITQISCGAQKSPLGNVGLDLMSFSETVLGENKSTYRLVVTCSTISPEKLDSEIERIKKESN